MNAVNLFVTFLTRVHEQLTAELLPECHLELHCQLLTLTRQLLQTIICMYVQSLPVSLFQLLL